MTIRALPLSTVRLLGSSVNISTPPALIKELLDNALDARATLVEVTISANTIDKIQVKDNGEGISMDDFDCLGRRAHTSKLQSFDELQRNEIRTLGFRGEAIAAANSLAVITILTKSKSDPIATRIRLKAGLGGVETQSPAAAPVGTTVKAEKLFEAIPVRKQQALKESHKAISKIKNLLQAYAMARPDVKLSLKVIGEPQQDWMYAPSPTPTIQDAVMKIFGKDLAAACEHVPTNSALDHNSSEKETQCIIEAVMPRGTCEPRLLNGKGAFVSVDSRPLSSTIGFGKKLVSIFKSHYGSLRDGKYLAAKLSSPFLRVSIQCSHINYDFNVAPLKDEVLFAEEQKVLDIFEKLCRDHYQRPDSLKNSPAQPMIQALDEFIDSTEQPPRTTAQGSSSEPSHPEFATDGTVEIQEDTPQYSQMRTSIKVDLGRTVSDSTNEHDTADTVLVQVPPEPLMRGKCDFISSKVKKGANGAALLRKPQDLHRYFKSKRQEGFQIATDDTATEERLPGADTVLNSSEPAPGLDEMERPPLRPLMASDINHMESEVRESLGDSEPEAEILWPRHVAVNSPHLRDTRLDTASPEVVNTMTMTMPMPIFESSSPHRRIQNARLPVDLTMASPQMASRSNAFALQSPPPSSPRPRNRQTNLPFRPPTIRTDGNQDTSPYQTAPRVAVLDRNYAEMLDRNRRERRVIDMSCDKEFVSIGSPVVGSPGPREAGIAGRGLSFSTPTKT